MKKEPIAGLRVFEFFRSKGYTVIHREFGLVSLKPKDTLEIGCFPLTIYYSHPYPWACIAYYLAREGFKEQDFGNWMEGHG